MIFRRHLLLRIVLHLLLLLLLLLHVRCVHGLRLCLHLHLHLELLHVIRMHRHVAHRGQEDALTEARLTRDPAGAAVGCDE